MSKDPIAWLEIGADGIASEYRVLHHSKPSKIDSWSNLIPLYTAPRELSDEEIRQIYIEAMESPYTHQQSYFGFARAILKKASEK